MYASNRVKIQHIIRHTINKFKRNIQRFLSLEMTVVSRINFLPKKIKTVLKIIDVVSLKKNMINSEIEPYRFKKYTGISRIMQLRKIYINRCL